MAKVTPITVPAQTDEGTKPDVSVETPDQAENRFLKELNEVYEKNITDLQGEVLRLQATRNMEAPASVNFRMVSQSGLALQFTLRGDKEDDLIARLGKFVPALTAIHMVPEGGRSTPAVDSNSPATPTLPGSAPAASPTAPAPSNGNGTKPASSFHAVRLEVSPRSDGKVSLGFFEQNMKWATVTSVKEPDKAAEMLAKTGSWTAEHFNQGAVQYNVSMNVKWVPSDKLNSKGNPYKNIVAVEPA